MHLTGLGGHEKTLPVWKDFEFDINCQVAFFNFNQTIDEKSGSTVGQ